MYADWREAATPRPIRRLMSNAADQPEPDPAFAHLVTSPSDLPPVTRSGDGRPCRPLWGGDRPQTATVCRRNQVPVRVHGELIDDDVGQPGAVPEPGGAVVSGREDTEVRGHDEIAVLKRDVVHRNVRQGARAVHPDRAAARCLKDVPDTRVIGPDHPAARIARQREVGMARVAGVDADPAGVSVWQPRCCTRSPAGADL